MNYEALERSGHGLFEVLSRNLPGGTQKNLSRYLGRDWHQAPSEYKFRPHFLFVERLYTLAYHVII
jgi:hypothetical protein